MKIIEKYMSTFIVAGVIGIMVTLYVLSQQPEEQAPQPTPPNCCEGQDSCLVEY